MPAQAKFNKVHVDFMGHTPQAKNFILSKALIIAEKTGIDNEFSAAILNIYKPIEPLLQMKNISVMFLF